MAMLLQASSALHKGNRRADHRNGVRIHSKSQHPTTFVVHDCDSPVDKNASTDDSMMSEINECNNELNNCDRKYIASVIATTDRALD